MADLLREGVAAGELAEDTDIDVMAWHYLGVLQAVLNFPQAGADPSTLDSTLWGLGDRNDLKLSTGCTDYIPHSVSHQRPCHWGHEGNGTGLGVRFVLSHDMIVLHAPTSRLKVTVLSKATVSVGAGLVMT